MKPHILSCLAVSAVLGAASSFASVTFTAVVGTTNTTPWDASFGGGALAVETLSSPTFGSHVNDGIGGAGTANRAFMQSFKGDGNVLEGLGILFGTTNPDNLAFTVGIYDFGDISPATRATTQAQFTAATAIFTQSVVIASVPSNRQGYFDFEGSSSIQLELGRSYGFYIEVPAGLSLFLDRSGGDAFADGAARKHNTDAATFDSGLGGGPRALNFALYTAPIPEPSSFAALAGALTLGFAASRRRRSA